MLDFLLEVFPAEPDVSGDAEEASAELLFLDFFDFLVEVVDEFWSVVELL